jgi:PII-like signaling protein
MKPAQPAKLLEIYLSERDQFEGKPAYEAVLEACRVQGAAGATVFRADEGYGASTEIHQHHLMRSDRPIIVHIVDSADKIEQLRSSLEPMIDTAVLIVSDVTVHRVDRQSGAKSAE